MPVPDFRETFHSIERSIGREFGANDPEDSSKGSPKEEKDTDQDRYHAYKEIERGDWRQGTIEHRDMPEGGREFERYQQVFALDPEELRGKVVLDLGAGPEAKLAHGLQNFVQPWRN